MTPQTITLSERVEPGVKFRLAYNIALYGGTTGMTLAMLVGWFIDPSFRRFFFAYLVSFAFFLTISLGALFFVLLQHLTRAGWSVGVRRIAEVIACGLPILGALSAPIILSVLLQNGDLYRWAIAGDAEGTPLAHILHVKHAWLKPSRFILSVMIYFIVWSFIAIWYWRWSVEQDTTGDDRLTLRMQALAPPALIIFGLTVTFASFDLIMSLDPAWFSTMFGIYFFAGCAVSIFATLIIIVFVLQRAGYLTKAVSIEHFHDLGKFLFAFTFFWGYIAFSQYMLLWYANIPETTAWYLRRGATTISEDMNGWTVISLLLLFGHLLIPFAGLMSRHIKRRKQILVFWAAWMLVFHWLDLAWLVLPEMDTKVRIGFIDLFCFVGVGGVFAAGLLKLAIRHSLRPVADPRSMESIVFENI